MIEIREYKFDDEEMIFLLRHHFGSDAHFREHKQHFYRNPEKKFFVAFQAGTVSGYCSLHKHEIKDLTTLASFRGRGIATEMVRYLQAKCNDYLTIGTDCEAVEHIVTKLGFVHTLNRGRYHYFKWESL